MKCLVFLVLVAVCQGFFLGDSPQREQQRVDQLRRMIEKSIPKVEQWRKSHRKEDVGFNQLKQRVPLEKTIQLEEQREKQEQKQYPTQKSKLEQKWQQTPLKSSIQLNRHFEKSPLQGIPHTSYYQYTKPQTFLDYIKTFSNNEPWNQITSVYPDVLDFKTFRDLIQFPGGDFLQQEIDKCLWNMPEDERVPVYLPTNQYTSRFPFDTKMEIDMRKVEGVRDVLPYIVTKLEKMVPLYMETTTNDPSTMAMLVTRDLVKIVLHGRMKCPTTTWDKYFIENINNQLFNVINEEKYQLLENFRTLLPEVLPEVPDMIEQLVYTITQDIQGHVRKDVMQYAHDVAFKDVAVLTHKLYHELKRVLEESWQQDVPTLMQQLVTVVAEVVTNCGTCPREHFFYNKNKLACWDFNKLFLEREFVDIHSRVMNIVHKFLYRTCNEEECMQFYPRVAEVFKTIIKQYIATIIQRVPMCQTPECRDPTECMLKEYRFLEPTQAEGFETRIPMWNRLWNTLWSKSEQDRKL